MQERVPDETPDKPHTFTLAQRFRVTLNICDGKLALHYTEKKQPRQFVHVFQVTHFLTRWTNLFSFLVSQTKCHSYYYSRADDIIVGKQKRSTLTPTRTLNRRHFSLPPTKKKKTTKEQNIHIKRGACWVELQGSMVTFTIVTGFPKGKKNLWL